VEIPITLRAALLAVGCCAGSLWALRRFLASVRSVRLIVDTPLVRIRSAAQGYAKLYGRARSAAPAPTKSPLTFKPCVWWSYEISRRGRNRSLLATWLADDSATSIEPFILDDGDGTCMVGPVCAMIVPTATNVWYGNTPWPEGPPGLFQTFFNDGVYRYTERRIDLDAALTVLGDLRSGSALGNAEADAGAVLREWKRDQPALLARFDADHDGRISAAEWDAARQAATAEAQATVASTPIQRTTVIQQPANGEDFIIAPMDSEQLVRLEQRRALGFFSAGLGFIVLWAVASKWPWLL